MCRDLKPLGDFAFRNRRTGRRQAHCRTCHAAYRRGHYLRNREDYVRREVARMNGYRAENRVHLIDYFTVHPCVDCGETDPVVLDFDHRDPQLKKADVSLLAARTRWSEVLREIEKCDVRCASCHRRRTAHQFNWSKARVVDTAIEPVLSDTAPSLGVIFGGTLELFHTCTGCAALKPVTEFACKDRKTGRRTSRCRSCVAAYSRHHYSKRREDYVRRAKKRHKGDRAALRARVLAHLICHPCVDCGETDPLVLEFDHRDGAAKVQTVAVLLRRKGWRAIEREMEKCDVRCANCHRRRTARQFGWSKLAAVPGADPPLRLVNGAGVAQLEERLVPNQQVAGSFPVSRSEP